MCLELGNAGHIQSMSDTQDWPNQHSLPKLTINIHQLDLGLSSCAHKKLETDHQTLPLSVHSHYASTGSQPFLPFIHPTGISRD